VRDATGLTRSLTGWDALVGNLSSMGMAYSFVYAWFAAALFPGVNLPLTVAVALVPGVIISLIYYLFTVSMPRTGGDFVWVGRVVHPSVGFLISFLVAFTVLSFAATDAVWSISYGFVPMLDGLGIVTSNTGLSKMAATISSPMPSFLISVVLFSIFIVPLFFRIKLAYRVLWMLFVLSLIGTLALVLAYFSAPNSIFISNFNRLSGMNYQNTISAAGLTPGFTLAMTLTGSVYTISTFIGFNFSAYYAGEVKQPRKSQIFAMIGSLGILAILLALVYSSAYYSAGPSFLSSAATLYGVSSMNYTLPVAPILNFLVTFANPNPIIIILSGLALVATGCAGITSLSFIAVRNLFAWSFDRIMPSKLASVDLKRNSPNIAVMVVWLAGVLLVALYVYTIFFQFLVYTVINFFLIFAIASVAAILFPYKRKDIFSSSPSIVTKKIKSLPLISFLGILGLVVSVFLSYSTVQPAVTAPPSSTSGPLVQALAYSFVPLSIIIALLIYALAYAYRKRQGLDMSIAFREIPPE
jgi:amino acid transporter